MQSGDIIGNHVRVKNELYLSRPIQMESALAIDYSNLLFPCSHHMAHVISYILLSILLINAFRSSAIHLTPKPIAIIAVQHDDNAKQEQKTTSTSGSIGRNLVFWGRAGRIYTSYKLLQVKIRGKKIINRVTFRRNTQMITNTTQSLWENQHEVNSQRMINMCLGLRGFYLKTGQFLGTRHDFMPQAYTKKLSTLHDNVPPLSGTVIRQVLETELNGPIEQFFIKLNLDKPIGSASVAQVHDGIWRATGEHVAVKIQYPNAEKLMKGDLRNLRMLAEFLQRTELKFDILSSIKELQKNIHNEFDFINEGKNMDMMRIHLKKSVPEVQLPRSIFASKRALVMTYIEGSNLGRLSEFSHTKRNVFVPLFAKQQMGRQILDVLAKAWGEMIFNLQFFNAGMNISIFHYFLHTYY
jgi:predicted unusual protein kinase regulating ubiquinone biosynthesis (AarF/ABC1/UbiB family)